MSRLAPLAAAMQTLPSIAAAHLERQGKLTDAAMRDVVEYTRGDYATALMKGRSDPQATEAMLRRVTELTGLDPQFVRRAGGRAWLQCPEEAEASMMPASALQYAGADAVLPLELMCRRLKELFA